MDPSRRNDIQPGARAARPEQGRKARAWRHPWRSVALEVVAGRFGVY